MLKLIDITKEYIVEEESTLALHDVSIEFRQNEFVAILGPSGCGKTTLLNIVGGLDRYTKGDIQIDGISTKEYDDIDWDTYRNRRIGFVFQSYNLIPHMNILKNVALCLTLAGVGKEERKERALEALAKVGLESQARKKPNQLSGGQMQRVAIARALINNPDIILADEPTGALDTESGIQIMDLLKEVARDRLVIMVTHNPQLADEYSTRIVYLKDGEVVGDTMPYDSVAEAEAKAAEEAEKAEDAAIVDDFTLVNAEIDMQATTDGVEHVADDAAETVTDENKKNGKLKRRGIKGRLKLMSKWMMRHLKRREKNKSSMKLSTAVSLSWNNLISKKGRTLLTSIAGSIGIIGIILVLSLSNGVKAYITRLEENALSQYPITVGETNISLSAALTILTKDTDKREAYPDNDNIYIKKVLGNFISELPSILSKNDLAAFKKYIDANFDTSLGTVKYDYGTTLNIYSNILNNETEYMKVNPFTDSMAPYLDAIPDLGDIMDSIKEFADDIQISAWDEMSSNQQLLNQQYELLGKSKWPTSANEIVIVLDEKNQIIDYMQFVLGILSAEQVADMFSGTAGINEAFSNTDDFIGLQYKVLTDADYFYVNEETGQYEIYDKSKCDIAFVEANGVTLNVVGVIRPKEGSGVTSINGVVGYTHALTEQLIHEAADSEIGRLQRAEYEESVLDMARNSQYASRFAGMTDAEVLAYFDGFSDVSKISPDYQLLIRPKSVATYACSYKGADGKTVTKTFKAGVKMQLSEYRLLMSELGIADLSQPKSIKFYCASFDSKDKIVAFIDQYISDTGREVKYSDNLSLIMGYVGTLTTTVTGVLVGFAAISLIVSTIMIAIIIYTSVLERRKEIGVLRSIGARKKDISRVFLAESAILGGYSGLIGLFFSYLISLAGSAILRVYFEIGGLMTITWWHCLMMLLISILLSMFAGFVPSRIAARKDPAIALRSE